MIFQIFITETLFWILASMLLVLIIALILTHIAVIIWVYNDAKIRKMESKLWFLITFSVGLIGLAVYLVVRNPIPIETTPKTGELYENDIKSIKFEISYKETGFPKTKKITTLDLSYSFIIGVLGGIISSLIPFSLLIKVWFPFTGGTQLVSGHHVIWASIVYGLTKKKYNIFLTMFSKGLLEFLLGDPWGLLILFVNCAEAYFLIVSFVIFEGVGEKETKLGWGLAGGFGNFSQAIFFWFANQRFYLHWSLWALAIIFAFISGILIVGILGRAIKNYLIKAGVPTTF
jgi:hypothetical protein